MSKTELELVIAMLRHRFGNAAVDEVIGRANRGIAKLNAAQARRRRARHEWMRTNARKNPNG